MKGKKIVLLTLFLAICALQVASAKAENPYVWVEDEQGNIRDLFHVGEKLRIVGYDGSGSQANPYKVTLYYSSDNGATWQEEWSSLCYQPDFDSGLLSDATDKLGRWKVQLKNYECKYAVGMYNVIPEVGILGALGACFAGLGIKRLRAKGEV